MDASVKPLEFCPPRWLAGTHVQSVLSSTEPRRGYVRRRAANYLQDSKALVLDCGEGVRLAAEFNPAHGEPNGRLVVILHGWEGSNRSTYNLTLGPRLQALGFDTVRLNLRDHGDSHHLNVELFHSCRLPEVVGAFRTISRLYPDRRISAVGYSLGGNFSLRVARELSQTNPTRDEFSLEQVVALCPVLDPVETMHALTSGPMIYQNYFIKKWRSSLVKKRAAFPDKYEFRNLSQFDDIGAMTEYFVLNYTEYNDLLTYLRGYALTDGRLDGLEIPSVALLAADDPVIPIKGLERLDVPAALQVRVTEQGGHCGYLTSLLGDSWADDFVVQHLKCAR